VFYVEEDEMPVRAPKIILLNSMEKAASPVVMACVPRSRAQITDAVYLIRCWITRFHGQRRAMLMLRRNLFVLAFCISSIYSLRAQWIQTHGPCGGTICAITSDGTNLYAGTLGAGIFVSTDKGENWRVMNTGLASLEITSLAVKGNSVFAGTYGGGIFASTNDGLTWTAMDSGLVHSERVSDSLTPTEIRTARHSLGSIQSVFSHDTLIRVRIISSLTVCGNILFAGTQGAGVYRFIDSIGYWTAVDSGLVARNWVFSLAATDSAVFAATESGLYCTNNNGTSWNAMNNGLVDGVFTHNINAVAVHGDTIFAGTDVRDVFRSTDYGMSWEAVNNGLSNKVIHSLIVDDGNIFAGTGRGIFLSTDNGSSWSARNTELTNGYVYCLYADTNILFSGTSGSGIFSSTNNGSDWTDVSGGIINSHITSLASDGNHISAGTFSGEVFLSMDKGAQWNKIYRDASNNPVYASYVSDNILLVGLPGGGMVRSTNYGSDWLQANDSLAGLHTMAFISIGQNLFAGTGGGMFLSVDAGSTWVPMNNGLTNIQIRHLAKSGNVIYAYADGGVFYTDDEGASWIALPKIFVSSSITAIAANNNTIFAGTWEDGVFRFDDGDSNWIAVNNGLTNPIIYSLVAIDTNVFAGTSSGVFLSTDNGDFWNNTGGSLSDKQIQTLAIGGSDLIAGTFSDGVWRRSLAEMIATGILNNDNRIPSHFALRQNFPNPFNPNTTISFSLPAKAIVSLKVFDILGREVASLACEELPAGNHSRQWRAKNISSGIYFCRLQASSFTETKKLVLLR
jgi:photosystem II stability/assembly factor-like uncharacterized protein